MSDQTFSHLVEVDEAQRRLRIYRVFSDGKRHLYTETQLPPPAAGPNNPVFERFARTLGENILMDSPAGRRALGL
jgi:hypothetical protein